MRTRRATPRTQPASTRNNLISQTSLTKLIPEETSQESRGWLKLSAPNINPFVDGISRIVIFMLLLFKIMRRRRVAVVAAVVVILKNKRILVLVFCLIVCVCCFAGDDHVDHGLNSIIQKCINNIKAEKKQR